MNNEYININNWKLLMMNEINDSDNDIINDINGNDEVMILMVMMKVMIECNNNNDNNGNDNEEYNMMILKWLWINDSNDEKWSNIN